MKVPAGIETNFIPMELVTNPSCPDLELADCLGPDVAQATIQLMSNTNNTLRKGLFIIDRSLPSAL